MGKSNLRRLLRLEGDSRCALREDGDDGDKGDVMKRIVGAKGLVEFRGKLKSDKGAFEPETGTHFMGLYPMHQRRDQRLMEYGKTILVVAKLWMVQ